MKPFGKEDKTIKVKQSIACVIKTSAHHLKELLYPMKCLKCGIYMEPSQVVPKTLETCFCDHCMSAGFYPIEQPYCSKCGIQLPKSHIDNHVCGICLKTPLNLEKIRATAEYKGIIKEAIPLFKYHSKLSLAKVFEALLFETLLIHFAKDRIDLIIPIPLHRAKLRHRGFNQAFMLARNFKKQFCRHFGSPPAWDIDIHAIDRQKDTDPQTGFDIDQRRNNLKNAFCVAEPERIKDRSILLVDDVLTTGSTCNEAAGLLLRKGAKKVQALVLARA
ncbi:MAG: ComF family protein [Pseudomonadota bacterium]